MIYFETSFATHIIGYDALTPKNYPLQSLNFDSYGVHIHDMAYTDAGGRW